MDILDSVLDMEDELNPLPQPPPEEEPEQTPPPQQAQPTEQKGPSKDDEYNVWWNMPYRVDGEINQERQTLQDQWYIKYYGDTKENINRKQGGFYPGANNPLANLQNTFQGLSVPGLAISDFFMDAVGLLPGAGPLDDKWDKATKLNNDLHQGIRRVLSVVLPAIKSGGMTAGALQKLPKTMPFLQKALIGTGAFAAQEAAIIGISDEGEEDNALRIMSDFFPGVFGEKGIVPIPDWAKTLDDDSPSVRKYKNMYDTAGLSLVGSTLGAFIRLNGAKRVMDWMEPLDDKALQYKAREILNAGNPEKIIRLQEINTILSTEQIAPSVRTQLTKELDELKGSLGITESIDDYLRQVDDARTAETTEAGQRKLDSRDIADTTLDPDITPIVDESTNARQTPPPGNVARNIADTTANKVGISSGDNAPIITEAMRTRGLMVGSTSRDAVLGVAEEARDLGRFNALVDGFRFTTKQMDSAAWSIYEDIIAAENVGELKELFLQDRDVKNMLMGKFKVEYINEEQARAAAFAMRDLTDRFLGRHVANSSARVMDTLGREAATMSQAIQELQPFVDDGRAMDLIIDKMQFLLDEYALNKYIAGWQLRNKNWFDNVPPKDIDTVIDTLTQEFQLAENSIHARNLRFTTTLRDLAETNPLAMRPLIDAFAESRGEVDTLAKLYRWAADKITPMGLLKSPDPKQLNLFARGAWGVRYNNVLSGLSAFRAGIGNTGQLILRPITSLLGHGLTGPFDGFEGLKRTLYYNGALFETNRRALHDAFQMMKRAHKDPEVMVKAYRKDFIFKETKDWDILEEMRPVWEAQGNWGRIVQYDIAKTLYDLAKAPWLRTGMTGMTFPDVFTWTHMNHWLTRVRAYDDVFSEFGFADWKKIAAAEKKIANTMFDAEGLPKDAVLKSLTGEISLNLDDGLATWINQGTTAYPVAKELFMFPRTGSNVVKNAASWTPISLIPGISKYSKTIYAGNNPDLIAKALAEHGIDMATTPNAHVIYQNLRAEYMGRMAFSSLMTFGLWQHAMAGNIRGNGHYNASRRRKERDQFGYDPKTIKFGDKWVSYKGLIGVEQVLSILGDMAYYANDIEQPMLEDWQAKVMWTISAAFLNETPLQGMEPLVAALNGDLTAFNRLAANMARGWIPQSSALGVLSDAISSTQKDIQGEIHEYVMNRLPGLSGMLPDQVDIWTGEPLNDIDNPWLKGLNAINPMKVSDGAEDWRIWLHRTGWRGHSKLGKDSTGSYTYSTKEREIIGKYIGEEKLFKQIQSMMKSGKYDEDLDTLRSHRITSEPINEDRIKLDVMQLPVNRLISKMVREAQKRAELRMAIEYPNITNTITLQRLGKEAMRQGKVEDAIRVQQKGETNRKLLEYGGAR